MKDIHFKVWHLKEQKMYFRGYQKWLTVLLCDDDKGSNQGKGKPVKRAAYRDCLLLESTGIFDKTGKEIFESDIVRIKYQGREFVDTVGDVPDTFGVKIHPLKSILDRQGIKEYPQTLEMEILGNEFEGRTPCEQD